MAGLQFTAVHVRSLLELSRTELHRWLMLLPPFNKEATQARTARRFTINDLAFFSLIALLHRKLGLPVSAIAPFAESLYEHVSRPTALNTPAARIFLNQDASGSWDASADAQGSLSLSIDTEPIWNTVYDFIGLSMPAQRELGLGLISVSTTNSKEPARGRRAN